MTCLSTDNANNADDVPGPIARMREETAWDQPLMAPNERRFGAASLTIIRLQADDNVSNRQKRPINRSCVPKAIFPIAYNTMLPDKPIQTHASLPLLAMTLQNGKSTNAGIKRITSILYSLTVPILFESHGNANSWTAMVLTPLMDMARPILPEGNDSPPEGTGVKQNRGRRPKNEIPWSWRRPKDVIRALISGVSRSRKDTGASSSWSSICPGGAQVLWWSVAPSTRVSPSSVEE